MPEPSRTEEKERQNKIKKAKKAGKKYVEPKPQVQANPVSHAGAPSMPAPATVQALQEEADNYTYYGGGGCFGEFSTV
jgi:hypothetical protein